MNDEIKVDESTGEVIEEPDVTCDRATPRYKRMTLEDEVREAMENERERAAEMFWRYNHSEHESFSLIREELEESQEALSNVPKGLKEAWSTVRENDGIAFAEYCKQMQRDAIRAACECIQLAAMCQKGAESVYQH